jgi:hypothetical protein
VSPTPLNLLYHAATVAFQRALLRQTLAQAQGNHTAAAQALELQRTYFQLWLTPPRPPLTPFGYTLYPFGYRPHEPRAGSRWAPGRLPHAVHTRTRPPQTHSAPRPHARWLSTASHGAEATTGMALAGALDGAR